MFYSVVHLLFLYSEVHLVFMPFDCRGQVTHCQCCTVMADQHGSVMLLAGGRTKNQIPRQRGFLRQFIEKGWQSKAYLNDLNVSHRVGG